MGDYDTDIVITSVMKYDGKKGPGTRLEALLTDPELCGTNAKFVGCVPITLWYNGTDVFDKASSLILKVCKGHFVVKKDFKDPTKTNSKLESVTYKDNVIALL